MRRLLVVTIVFGTLVLPSVARAWAWPVEGEILAPFVLGDDPYAGGQHRGIDIAAARDEAVRAPASGVVTYAGSVGANGKVVTVETGSGYAVTLVHLGSIAVRKGDAVREGNPVGTIGPSGTPEHDVPYVHLGIRVAADPQGYVDPLGLLPPRVAPVPPPPPASAPAPAPAPVPMPNPAPQPPAHEAPPAAELPPAPVAEAPPETAPVAVVEAAAEPPVPELAATSAPSHEPLAAAAPAAKASAFEAGVAERAPTMPAPPAVPSSPGSLAREVGAESGSSTQLGGNDAAGPAAVSIDAAAHAEHGTRTDVRSSGDPRDEVIGGTRATVDTRALAADPGRRDDAGIPWLAVLIAAACGSALIVVGAWYGVPKLRTSALLPDNADLLRERDAAHRPRVHDDRSRHPRPALPATGG